MGEQRNVRVSPFHPREQELGAVFFETAGWERPWWYESNAELLEEYGDRVMPREAEWESRWWSPIVNAEHLAMRDRVAMIDLCAFHVLDVSGPGALRPSSTSRWPSSTSSPAASSTRPCLITTAASRPT